jgi:hypothetical protein
MWFRTTMLIAYVVVFSMFWRSEPISPKPIPLVIPEIEVGAKVTLINIGTHAFKVLRTTNTILKDTHVVNKQGSEPILLVELLIPRMNNLLMI